MSTQYRLVQSGKTASGGCSAGQGSSEPVAPQIYYYIYIVPVKVSKKLIKIRTVIIITSFMLPFLLMILIHVSVFVTTTFAGVISKSTLPLFRIFNIMSEPS
jgi:carbohydrate-binding DOMON domain-containing protein